jgi:hypothetical protein
MTKAFIEYCKENNLSITEKMTAGQWAIHFQRFFITQKSK